MNLEHNIFGYATSELSQDAVICWLLSFYNNKDSELYNLARDLLKTFMPKNEDLESTIEIKRQFYKTDILIHFPNINSVLIIEDKTYTSEHNRQIAKYVDLISKNNCYKGCKIHVVYFKTGFYNDWDKLVELSYKNSASIQSFKSVKCEEFLNILKNANYNKTSNYAKILEMYLEYLEYLKDCENNWGKFDNTDNEYFWNWPVSKSYIAQHKLMREIFPEEKWDKDKKPRLYMVNSGSSYGRPWTETNVLKDVFWRIDTDRGGPYLSLRYYDKFDKKNKELHDKHKDKYEVYFEKVKAVAKKHGAEEYCKVGQQCNYFEATLMHIHIKDVLKNWKNENEYFISKIRNITEDFIKAVFSKDCY